MNRDEAKQLWPIIQAYAEGKTIQWFNDVGEWKSLKEAAFNLPPNRYRIKPETIKIEHRRYLYKFHNYRICICTSRAEAEDIVTNSNFIRWIDPDWITEEVEINNESN